MKLNLFSSDGLHPDFLNVDIWEPPNATPGNFLKADLRKAWPWPDSSAETIRAYDGFEHLPSKVRSMNEAHRVLQPGGTLEIFIPTTDGRGAFQDPTHVSYWTPNDMLYYCEEFAEWQRFHEAYGVTARFRVPGSNGNANEGVRLIELAHREYGSKVWKLKITLEAVK